MFSLRMCPFSLNQSNDPYLYTATHHGAHYLLQLYTTATGLVLKWSLQRKWRAYHAAQLCVYVWFSYFSPEVLLGETL